MRKMTIPLSVVICCSEVRCFSSFVRFNQPERYSTVPNRNKWLGCWVVTRWELFCLPRRYLARWSIFTLLFFFFLVVTCANICRCASEFGFQLSKKAETTFIHQSQIAVAVCYKQFFFPKVGKAKTFSIFFFIHKHLNNTFSNVVSDEITLNFIIPSWFQWYLLSSSSNGSMLMSVH